jgi:hypothetical protein
MNARTQSLVWIRGAARPNGTINGVVDRRIDAEGSLELQPSHDARPAEVVRRIPVEAETEDVDGVPIHVLLHVVNGYMNELEVYREDSARLDRPLKPQSAQRDPLMMPLH